MTIRSRRASAHGPRNAMMTAGKSGSPMIGCLRSIARAGFVGGLAMVPIGLLLRRTVGASGNAYGDLIVLRTPAGSRPTHVRIDEH